jgi:FKBP-type peptidyl-prolyl cis-trans isomerase 2
VTHWLIIGIIGICTILVVGCSSADSPNSEAAATPPAISTSQPASTHTTETPPVTLTPPATPVPSSAAEGAGAKPGDNVTVHYTGRLKDGTVFDSSEGKDPLEFTIGEGQLIPGFEQGVLGMRPGQSKTVNIPAKDAYGPYNPELVTEVDRNRFSPDLELQVGMQVQGSQPDGQVAVFTVKNITNTTVTLDANHRLAGKDLIFDIKMVSIN